MHFFGDRRTAAPVPFLNGAFFSRQLSAPPREKKRHPFLHKKQKVRQPLYPAHMCTHLATADDQHVLLFGKRLECRSDLQVLFRVKAC